MAARARLERLEARPDGIGARTAEAIAALLWEACRRDVDAEAVTSAVTDAALDPPGVVRAAVDHGIGALVWRAVSQSGCADALGDPGRQLADAAEVHRLEAVMLLPRAVRAAVGPLTDAGLEPVVLKGPAVAVRYPAPGLRPMEDIDLLLPRRFHRPALRALTGAGWEVVRPAAGNRYDTVLRHGDVPSLVLELHYGLEAWYERTTRLDPDALWRRRIAIDCDGCAAFGLPLEDEITVLAAHAGKPFHGFRRLVWIADLAMVVGHAGSVDWDEVRAAARRGRCATLVAVALAMARRVGVDAPRAMFPLPSHGWRRGALDALVDPGWPVRHDELPTFHLRFALADTAWRRGVLGFGMLHDTSSWRGRAALPIRAARQAASRWRELNRARGASGTRPAR